MNKEVTNEELKDALESGKTNLTKKEMEAFLKGENLGLTKEEIKEIA